MKSRFSIAVFLTVVIVALSQPASLSAKQQQGVDPLILTAKDFNLGYNRSSVAGEAVIFKVQIHPKLPAYTLRLVPENESKATEATEASQLIGRIEVTPGSAAEPKQVIEVKTHALPSMFVGCFTMKDINFDGYLDLGVLDEFGAKWGSYRWWMFEPKSGRFAITALTKELLKVRGNMELEEAKRKIRNQNFVGTCPQNETYKISGSQLILTEKTERHCEQDTVTVRLWKRMKGTMRLVKTWEEKP
jgi:hypothetical protein